MKRLFNCFKHYLHVLLLLILSPIEYASMRFGRAYALPQSFPSLEAFAANMVTALGKVEVIKQPLYDYILYPTAGSAAPLNFFSVPAGSGLSSSSGNVANPKGLADTNMQLAGVLPAPQGFWLEGIEFDVQPGSSAAANAYVIQIPSAVAAAPVATLQAGAHDVNAILSGGVLQLNISNKPYFQEGPMLRFPPRAALALDAAVANGAATTVAATTLNSQIVTQKMRNVGEPNRIDPGLALMANQFFGVTVTYPTAIATPSGFNARIGCIMNGWLFRPVQ